MTASVKGIYLNKFKSVLKEGGVYVLSKFAIGARVLKHYTISEIVSFGNAIRDGVVGPRDCEDAEGAEEDGAAVGVFDTDLYGGSDKDSYLTSMASTGSNINSISIEKNLEV
ncbi:uncharacterized protein G2W53_010517 [Senna tora]|uniref:Uncharacterized protein n=1 Tax=Senna tora TaxID=362788 RepID=A0A834WZX4_9FABA|nr:uncharacterized protein G2W53_010517 [Senna tora]